MKRSIAILAVTIAVLIPDSSVGQKQKESQQGTTNIGEQVFKSAVPLILQQDDGEHLVHRTGPLGGVPFTIKVDSQFGRSEVFLFLPKPWLPTRRSRFTSITMLKRFSFLNIPELASLSEIRVEKRKHIRWCSFLETRGFQQRITAVARFTFWPFSRAMGSNSI
jgi:hypothetical protein